MAVDRARIARLMEREFQSLATDAGWKTVERSHGDDILTEGDYTDSISFALRELGFVDPSTEEIDVSLTSLGDEPDIVQRAIDHAYMRLYNYWSSRPDRQAGAVRLYLSQIARAMERRGIGGTGKAVRQARWGSSRISTLLDSA